MGWWWRLVKHKHPSPVFGAFKLDKPPHSLHTFSVDLRIVIVNGCFKKVHLELHSEV